jgi:hypothetical protein
MRRARPLPAAPITTIVVVLVTVASAIAGPTLKPAMRRIFRRRR